MQRENILLLQLYVRNNNCAVRVLRKHQNVWRLGKLAGGYGRNFQAGIISRILSINWSNIEKPGPSLIQSLKPRYRVRIRNIVAHHANII